MDNDKKEKKKGGCLKIFLIILLVLVVLAAVAAGAFWKFYKDESRKAEEEYRSTTYVGRDCPDFEVTATDGQKITMSELLSGKEALCIVMFATWCGPCEREFPDMDEVYRKYKDKFAMIALDVDSSDTEEDAKKYAESHGFAFPVAKADRDVLGDMEASAYPTTLIVDRNGKVGLHRIGSVTDAETFEKIVTAFMGDDYQESQLAYYTFYAYKGKTPIAGVEFTVTNEKGTQTYVTDEEGIADVFNDKPEDMEVQVTRVPDGCTIDGDGRLTTGTGSTGITLPVK